MSLFGDTPEYFEQLHSALEYFGNTSDSKPQTLKVLTSYTEQVTAMIEVYQSLTLDLNGQSVTLQDGLRTWDGTLNILNTQPNQIR